MKTCELCGASIDNGQEKCPRCGFEIPKKVYFDVRDQSIPKKYKDIAVETVKHDIKDKTSLFTSHFENLDVNNSTPEDITASVEEVLDFLQIPMIIGLGDELKFTEREEKLIRTLIEKLERSEIVHGVSVASARSYIKLANAAHCLGDAKKAMNMINKALLGGPNNPDALFGKAKLLFYEKRYDDAKRYLDKLLAKTKKDSKSMYLAEMIEQIISSRGK